MKKHTKIYLKYFGLTPGDHIPCEVCGRSAVDIHHINPRGMGGSKTKDVIENLQALCREHHNLADFGSGEEKLTKELLQKIHDNKLKNH